MADGVAVTDNPIRAPYIADDTRAWAESYRVNGKLKPALLFRAGTDANYIHDQFLGLPAYGNNTVHTKAILNTLSPGQRIPGVLTWSVTETLDGIVNQAQITILDALPVSRISTTVTGYSVGAKKSFVSPYPHLTTMPAQWHSTYIRYNWARNGDFVSQRLPGIDHDPLSDHKGQPIPGPSDGNHPINSWTDTTTGGRFAEEDLLYRVFEPEIIYVADISMFPDPAVPAEEASGSFTLEADEINEWWDVDSDYKLRGIGAYYIQVGTEVMRVTQIDRDNHALYIIPGGRGAAGYIQAHNVGDTVNLLGVGPFTGRSAGFGYLMPKDFMLQQSPMRPGNCFVSYEGYGNPGDYKTTSGVPVPLKSSGKNPAFNSFDRNHNMQFTGFWFVTSPEVQLENDGVPKFSATLQSLGYILTEQKITPDNLTRMHDAFENWALATFDNVNHKRNIPGDWVDYTSWEPTQEDAYPLVINIEYAQHKAFMDHMNSTDFGRQCFLCQKEWLNYVAQHEHGKPTGSITETRAVGKHIYRNSIRVFYHGGAFNAGPLKTYGRLMVALGIACWEHTQEADVLGTRWTKMPDLAFRNLRNWTNGRVWNGQMGFNWDGEKPGYDYSAYTHEDVWVHGNRIPLSCPFTASYDRQPWSQPIQDLADLNRMQFTITREGFPVFVPLGHKTRGCPSSFVSSTTDGSMFTDPESGAQVADSDVGRGEWHLMYGGSIDSYNFTIDPSQLITLVYVTGQTAFGDGAGDSSATFTIAAAGTGVQMMNDPHQQTMQALVWYSGAIGNKEGLMLTGGCQQTEGVSLDNIELGLSWNTNPASWGISVVRDSNQVLAVHAAPTVPNPSAQGQSQQLYQDSSDSVTGPGVNLVKQIQQFVNFMMERRYIGPAIFDQAGKKVQVFGLQIAEDGKWTDALTSAVKHAQSYFRAKGFKTAPDANGTWGMATYRAAKKWIEQDTYYLKTDIWWYVMNGLTWNEYVAAQVGLRIPQRHSPDDKSLYIIDQYALATEIQDWMKKFFKDVINYGNQVVDTSIQQAVQKVLTTNYADPRIICGDVIWAQVPSYLETKNMFGDQRKPFTNGIYVTNVTRSMDLQAGTYTGTYSGYRYKGSFDDNLMNNPSNYCSTKNNAI